MDTHVSIDIGPAATSTQTAAGSVYAIEFIDISTDYCVSLAARA
jgi:hypothetical protein